MCNLYRMKRSGAEAAEIFDVEDGAAGSNHGSLVFPGYPGLVVAQGTLCSMTWGFPLVLRGKSGKPLKPKPVNNARTDKLDSNFWSASFRERRCLIPLEDFAEAEGPKGAKTRTWLSLPDAPLMACAGIWREDDAWGRCYSMVMTNAAEATKAVHDRMPVILAPQDYRQWLDGTAQEARQLCVPYEGPITITRTDEPWVQRR